MHTYTHTKSHSPRATDCCFSVFNKSPQETYCASCGVPIENSLGLDLGTNQFYRPSEGGRGGGKTGRGGGDKYRQGYNVQSTRSVISGRNTMHAKNTGKQKERKFVGSINRKGPWAVWREKRERQHTSLLASLIMIFAVPRLQGDNWPTFRKKRSASNSCETPILIYLACNIAHRPSIYLCCFHTLSLSLSVSISLSN